MTADRTATRAVQMLSALAQPVRLGVVRLLVGALPGGLTAGAIAGELGIPANTLSFHLNHLTRAGLVTCESRGRRRIYRVACERLEGLVGYLTAHCCRGLESHRSTP